MFNRYLLGMLLVGLIILLAFGSALYHTFFVFVPAGQMLIIVAKTGTDLPPGENIATQPGQKGIQFQVYGEGRHFVLPYFYETRLEPLIQIPPGKIGVVTALVGKDPPPGTILVHEHEKGVWRRVLTPGKYRLNPFAFKIEVQEAIEIHAGFVGCVTSLVGVPPKGKFAEPGEQGLRKQVLQPGTYFLNPYEFRIQTVEVGINQVSFTEDNQIRFPSKDAFNIAVEATVEWELFPRHVAEVIAEFGAKAAIQEKVIIPQSKSIGRLQGSSYGAKEFLLGAEREKFQVAFTDELERICAAKNLTIHSAFIRHLTIPDNLLLPIRESFIAVEKEKTAKVWEDTRKSASELEREREMINQRRAEVKAETVAIVRTIAAEARQEVGAIEASTTLQVAMIEQEIAAIEAQKTIALGEAKASVTRLEGEARSKGLEARVKAFGDNPQAYANYSFARQLPDDLELKMIYSGEGTLWTDLQTTAGLAGIGALQNLPRSRTGRRQLGPTIGDQGVADSPSSPRSDAPAGRNSSDEAAPQPDSTESGDLRLPPPTPGE